MAGEVEPCDLLLHGHALLGRNLGKLRHRHGHPAGLLAAAGVKESHLPLHIPPPGLGDGVHHRLVDGQELAAAQGEAVAGAALDEVFHGALVELRAVHSGTEVLQAPVGAAPLALLYNLVDKAAADVLYRRQTEADALFHHGEVGGGLV